jgi:glycosyltransferase involved in cell wall biosynthesis
MTAPDLVLVANARMPSQRAQSLQVAQAAAAFARAGVRTRLAYAQRRDTPALPPGDDLWSYYAVGDGPHPEALATPCVDWIDRVPRKLQYLPARMQELSFAMRATRDVRALPDETLVFTRELEVARSLAGRPGVFLELHRVPAGRLRLKWLRHAAANIDGIVAISNGIAVDLEANGVRPRRVLVEHDAYAPARFAALPAREAARAELDLPLDRPIVVYTGGLLAWKGVEILVEAARALPAALFVIAGGMDADVARLRELAPGAENIRFDGFQPPSRVSLYLAAGDVGVVPNRSRPAISARYTSPLKVFEAMAASLPLVVSDLPSLREILNDEEAVFVAPDDAVALAAGLEAVLGDDARRAALGARLGERAPQHTWDARAERLLAWMRSGA